MFFFQIPTTVGRIKKFKDVIRVHGDSGLDMERNLENAL